MYRCLSNNTMHIHILRIIDFTTANRFLLSKIQYIYVYKISRADIFPLLNFYSTNFFYVFFTCRFFDSVLNKKKIVPLRKYAFTFNIRLEITYFSQTVNIGKICYVFNEYPFFRKFWMGY